MEWYGLGTELKYMSSDDNRTSLSSGRNSGESWRLRGSWWRLTPTWTHKSQKAQNLDEEGMWQNAEHRKERSSQLMGPVKHCKEMCEWALM